MIFMRDRSLRFAYIIKPEDLGSVNIGHLSNFFYILSNYDMMQIFVKPSIVDWLLCLLHTESTHCLTLLYPLVFTSSVYLPANITYNILCSHPELKNSRCQSVHNRSSGISPILSVLEGPLPENPITDAMNM